MSILPKSIRKLIEELSKLPGIGPKSASRLAFFLLKSKDLDRQQLSEAIADLKVQIQFCRRCYNLAEKELCGICSNSSGRNQNLICVVEEPMDVVSLEQGRYNGTYHVLGGVISPIDGVGPQDLRIDELVERVRDLEVPTEIIIATNPSLEGEGTALYLAKKLKGFPNIKLTRIAHGLPIGGDIEYADELTIAKALEGRREYSPSFSPPREGEIERGS